jgi:hypothetical protein
MQSSNVTGGSDPLQVFTSALKITSSEYTHLPVQHNEIRLLQGHVNEHGALVGNFQSFILESSKAPDF